MTTQADRDGSGTPQPDENSGSRELVHTPTENRDTELDAVLHALEDAAAETAMETNGEASVSSKDHHNAKAAIKTIIARERADEIGAVQIHYGPYAATTFVTGKPQTVEERYAALKNGEGNE